MGATIGVLGRFDADEVGAALVARVLGHELRRRLPEADVRFYAPYGWERPSRLDGGEPAEPLGAWTRDRAADLAERLDLAIVLPWEGDDERDRWLAPGALDEALVPVEEVPTTPHLAVLADDLVPRPVLEKRLAYLRLLGAWPEAGPVQLHEGDAGLLVNGIPLPADLSLEDVVGVVAVADDAELATPALLALRRAYHGDPGADRAAVDLWFEGLHAALDKATAGRVVERAHAAQQRIADLEARLAALRVAYDARGQRLVDERLVFADHVDALQREFGATHAEVVEARARAERDAARADLERLLRERADELRAAADVELTRIKASRSWRWTAPWRALGGRLRRTR